MYTLKRSQKLPISQDVAWAFFSNPANLLHLTPSWVHISDQTLQPAKSIRPGYLFVVQMKLLHLFPVWWAGKITEVQAPHSFVDELCYGPFRFWHHTHRIVPIPGGVEIQDTVQYALPLPIISNVLHTLLVKHQINRLFDYRAKMLVEFFG